MKIYLYGRVDDWMMGYIIYKLSEAKGSDIDLFVNSLGGNLFAGMAIYENIKRYEGKVTCYIDGMAGSMASVIPLACDDIYIGEGGSVMIHDPLTRTEGNAQAHEVKAKILKGKAADMEAIYAKALGKTEKEIAAIMQKETWYNSKEAVEVGYAKAITSNKNGNDVEASFDANSIVAELEGYKNVPDYIMDAYKKNEIENNSNIPKQEDEMDDVTIPKSDIEMAKLIGGKDTKIESLTTKVGELEGSNSELLAKIGELQANAKDSIATISALKQDKATLQLKIDESNDVTATAEMKKIFAEKYPNFVGETLEENFKAYKEVKDAGLEASLITMEKNFQIENDTKDTGNKIFSGDGSTKEPTGEAVTDAQFNSMVAEYQKENECSYETALEAVGRKTGDIK